MWEQPTKPLVLVTETMRDPQAALQDRGGTNPCPGNSGSFGALLPTRKDPEHSQAGEVAKLSG